MSGQDFQKLIEEKEHLDRVNAKLALDFAAVSVERDSLRGVVQAVRDLRQKYSGWPEPVPIRQVLSDLAAVVALSSQLANPEDALGLNDAAKQIIDELRDLWQRALEREGNLASAVADTVWKATQYGTTEDGDTAAYLVPKGTMHRLVGVAQSNGAHVPVSFRAALAAAADAPQPAKDQR